MRTPLLLLALGLLTLGLQACDRPAPEGATPEAVFVASEEWKGPARDYPQPNADQGPLACDPTQPTRCRTDQDCACGRGLGDGACTIGTSACVEADRPCPELCGAPESPVTLACQAGQCAKIGL